MYVSGAHPTTSRHDSGAQASSSCAVHRAVCSVVYPKPIENCVQCAVVCALRNIHLASVTIRYVFINWVVTLLRPRPSGPNRAELYSSGILRTQTFFLEGVYFMARHDVGAQAYRHQSRTVFQWHSSHIQTVCVGRGPIFSTSFTHPHLKNRTGTWLFIPGGLCTMTCKGMLRIVRFSRSCSGFGKT